MLKPWPRWWMAFGGDLVSVIPWDADSDTIEKHLRGKVPGIRKANGKWIGLVGSMVDRIMTEAEAKQAHADGAAIGMMGRNPALDIDVDDEAEANDIQEEAFAKLGKTPVRRREGSARRLLMYGGGSRLRKIRLAFRPAGADEDAVVRAHAVEWLGYLQYYNVWGVHPSGQPYYWEDGDPCDLGPFGLPDPDERGIKGLFADLSERFSSRLIAPLRLVGGATSGVRTKLTDQRLWAPSPQLVLNLLGEYRPESMGHDEFVQHMVAIKAALGEAAEDHYGEVLDWAPGVRSTEDAATRKVWDSITDATLGWDWLSAKSGTTVAAQAEFADPPDEANMPEDPREKVLRPIFERWVYDTVDAVFRDRTDGSTLTRDGFNAEHTNLARYGVTGLKAASAQVINDPRLVRVRETVYLPGKDVLIDGKYNLWRPSNLVPIRNVRPDLWLDHVAEAFPNEASRNHFLDWISFALQHRGQKINHALMLHAPMQGIGKDTLFEPLMHGLGKYNVARVTADSLTGQFNSYLNSELVICNEMTPFSEKKNTYNHLKQFLCAPPDFIPLNEKFKNVKMVPNTQNWIFLSNHANAMSLEEDDRRFFVELIALLRHAESHYQKLYQWLKDGGNAITVGWLLNRDIRHFNPYAPPPLTEAKREMIRVTSPLAVQWVLEQFDELGPLHKRMFVVAGEIFDLDQWGAMELKVHQGHVMAALKRLNFRAIPGRHRIDGEVATVWTRDQHPEIMKLGGELLAARVKADRRR